MLLTLYVQYVNIEVLCNKNDLFSQNFSLLQMIFNNDHFDNRTI